MSYDEREEEIVVEVLKCEVCEKALSDWAGNVMIPEDYSPNDVSSGTLDDLQIWCKECTVKLDEEGTGRKYHNLWELKWVKEEREKILQNSLYADNFSERIKEKMHKLINS